MLRSTAIRAGFRHVRLHVERAREEELAGRTAEAARQLFLATEVAESLRKALVVGYIPEMQCVCDAIPENVVTKQSSLIEEAV